MRGIADAEVVAQLQQLEQALVRLLGVEEHEVDNDQIVAGAVGDQNVAVPVKDVAARSFDRRHILHGVRVGRHEAVFRLHRLKLIQPQHIAAHQERDQT